MRNGTFQIQIEHKVITDDPTYSNPIGLHLKDYKKVGDSRARLGKKAQQDIKDFLSKMDTDDIDGSSDTESSEENFDLSGGAKAQRVSRADLVQKPDSADDNASTATFNLVDGEDDRGSQELDSGSSNSSSSDISILVTQTVTSHSMIHWIG